MEAHCDHATGPPAALALAMTLLALVVVVAGFLTATLSGAAGLGGGTILIGLFYAIGMAPAEAVPLFAAVQLVSNASRTAA